MTTWREARIPKWALVEIERELTEVQTRAALAWPNEAEPTPEPFGWGAYDHLHGDPVPGSYWVVQGEGLRSVRIRQVAPGTWDGWRFQYGKDEWVRSKPRGKLYRTEREARIAVLWAKCRRYAEELLMARKLLDQAEAKAEIDPEAASVTLGLDQ